MKWATRPSEYTSVVALSTPLESCSGAAQRGEHSVSGVGAAPGAAPARTGVRAMPKSAIFG